MLFPQSIDHSTSAVNTPNVSPEGSPQEGQNGALRSERAFGERVAAGSPEQEDAADWEVLRHQIEVRIPGQCRPFHTRIERDRQSDVFGETDRAHFPRCRFSARACAQTLPSSSSSQLLPRKPWVGPLSMASHIRRNHPRTLPPLARRRRPTGSLARSSARSEPTRPSSYSSLTRSFCAFFRSSSSRARSRGVGRFDFGDRPHIAPSHRSLTSLSFRKQSPRDSMP